MASGAGPGKLRSTCTGSDEPVPGKDQTLKCPSERLTQYQKKQKFMAVRSLLPQRPRWPLGQARGFPTGSTWEPPFCFCSPVHTQGRGCSVRQLTTCVCTSMTRKPTSKMSAFERSKSLRHLPQRPRWPLGQARERVAREPPFFCCPARTQGRGSVKGAPNWGAPFFCCPARTQGRASTANSFLPGGHRWCRQCRAGELYRGQAVAPPFAPEAQVASGASQRGLPTGGPPFFWLLRPHTGAGQYGSPHLSAT